MDLTAGLPCDGAPTPPPQQAPAIVPVFVVIIGVVGILALTIAVVRLLTWNRAQQGADQGVGSGVNRD